MLDDRIRVRLRQQRTRDQAQAHRRDAALGTLRMQAVLKVKDPAAVQKALVTLRPSRATMQPHEAKLTRRAEVWMGG